MMTLVTIPSIDDSLMNGLLVKNGFVAAINTRL